MIRHLNNHSKTTAPTILFTGGGSAGHVTPNLALIERCKQNGWQVVYAGSPDGIEKTIIQKEGSPYYAITSGKLRRYFSWQNFLDPLKIIWGMVEAYRLCRRLRPQVVFSKGGFVAFPVVVGAWLNRIPVIAHESDFSPGLANRLSFPFAKTICVTFEEGKRFFKDSPKVLVTGTPLRSGLLSGNRERGLAECGFTNQKPVILVIGGGLGAGPINTTIRQALPLLLQEYQIAHICGPGKCDPQFDHTSGYRQFEYVHAALADLFACASMIVSRAGANSIYEFIALGKPHLLIPLSKKASRGDQIDNAHFFEKRGISLVLPEEKLSVESLVHEIKKLNQNRETFENAIAAYPLHDSVKIITEKILSLVK